MPSSDLIRAYTRTRFWVDSPAGRFVLSVGVPSEELLALYHQYGVNQSAYVTAWNPRSEQCTRTENERTQGELISCIKAAGLHWLPGLGLDPDGNWSGEPSILVLGIDEPQALAIGREYRQHAIIYMAADAIPHLRFPLHGHTG